MADDESDDPQLDGDDDSTDADVNELATLELRAESSATMLVRTGTLVRILGYLVLTGAVIVTVMLMAQSGEYASSLLWSSLWTFFLGLANGAVLVVLGTYAEMRGLSARADGVRRRLAGEL